MNNRANPATGLRVAQVASIVFQCLNHPVKLREEGGKLKCPVCKEEFLKPERIA